MEATTAVLDPRTTLEKAIEKGMTPETIGKLMDLQERWEAGKARDAFVKAMSGFKRECPAVIGKDRKADFGAGKAKYSYATTAAIVAAITPALSKYGLHLSWETAQASGLVTVTCHITHEGGHRESATLTGPKDESGGKNPIQTLGSSVHYLQRYTMVSVLGLATADMDDPDQGDTRAPVSMPTSTSPKSETKKQDGAETLTAEGECGDVSKKLGGSPQKPWTLYRVNIGGETYSTFDLAIAEAAKALQGQPVKVCYTVNAKGYRDAVSIEAAAPAGVAGDGNGF
jgi:hypothetical protein